MKTKKKHTKISVHFQCMRLSCFVVAGMPLKLRPLLESSFAFKGTHKNGTFLLTLKVTILTCYKKNILS